VGDLRLDLQLGTELQIMAEELLFDGADLSKLMENMNSLSTYLEVLHFIYHQFSFTANS